MAGFGKLWRRRGALTLPVPPPPRSDIAATMRFRDVEIVVAGGLTEHPGDDHRIVLHKDLRFLSALVAIFDELGPTRMIEVGVLQGGSAIFWLERYGLERLVAIDLTPEIPSLTHYLDRHDLHRRVRTRFGVSQDERDAVCRAIQEDLAGEMADAIIDDASHQLDPTRATVEILLPFLREGGVYVIEDWAWGHHHRWPRELWSENPLMSRLVIELSLVCGAGTGVIDRVEIDPNFVVLRRGGTALPADGSFRLRDYYEPRGLPMVP